MTRIVFFGLAILLLSCSVQKKVGTQYQQVMVKDWGEKCYSVSPQFWEETKKEILTKISNDEFEKIKTYSDNENIPEALLQFDGHKLLASLDEYLKRLSTLKVYKVVEFSDISDGINYGKYAVLAVPYQDLDWDKAAKWDTIYFVIKAGVVEQMK